MRKEPGFRAALFFLALLLAVPGEVRGERGVMLREVVVTATRTAEEVVSAPASITVITAEEIAASTAQTLPDLLKGIAGIEVADFTGTGRTSTVDIRGFGETAGANTLVLVDGRRINAPDQGGIDWTAIPLHRIERVEIVRGGGSVLYGNNAVGGVINILTRHGASEPTVHSDTTFGSYRYFKQALGVSGSRGAWSYHLDGGYVETDGYRDNGELRNRTAGFGLSYDALRYGMNLSAGYKEDRFGLPGAVAEGDPRRSTQFPDDFGKTRERYVQATPYLLLPGDAELSVALRGRKLDSTAQWVRWDYASRFSIEDYGISPQVTRELTLFDLPHRVVAGVDYQKADIRYAQGAFVGQDRRRRETGAFVHDRIALRQDLFLTLGYRHTRTKYDIDGGGDDSFRTDSATIGLTWNYAPGSKLFVSADRAFRSVLLDELGGSGFNEILPPQISRHYQAGISHRFHARLHAEATLFRIDSRDEIFFDPQFMSPDGFWPGENVNYGRTRREGAELAARAIPHEKMHLSVNYTLMNNELRGGPYDGNDIPGVPRHGAAVRATVFPIKDLALDVRARWVGKKSMIGDWNTAVGDDWEGGDYIVTDAMLRYLLGSFTFYGGINNLFNEKYSEYGVFSEWGSTLYPAPERNYVAGLLLVHSF